MLVVVVVVTMRMMLLEPNIEPNKPTDSSGKGTAVALLGAGDRLHALQLAEMIARVLDIEQGGRRCCWVETN